MPLTDIQIRNAKADGKPRKLADAEGLYLYISVAGSKSWRLDYSYFGKRKTLTFGTYPGLSLADARDRMRDAKRILSENADPSLAKKREQMEARAAAGNTFGVIVSEFIEKLGRDKRAAPTISKNKWMLEVLAKQLHPYPVTQITSRDILEVLKKIEKSGRVETALATRSAVGRVFNFAISVDCH